MLMIVEIIAIKEEYPVINNSSYKGNPMRYSTCKGMVIIGESKVGLFFVFLEYLEL